MNILHAICLLSLFPFSTINAAITCPEALTGAHEPLVNYDLKTRTFKGLTPAGLSVLKTERDKMRRNKAIFDQTLLGLETLRHMELVARLAKAHILLSGPQGGAKSYFVETSMTRDVPDPFRLLLDQMTPGMAFMGGQNFAAAKKGRFVVNTKNSLVDSEVGLIDEIDKGNPGALGPLLSLLNERRALNGHKTQEAKLETLYCTSNATVPELQKSFEENGQGSMTAAFLNRFLFKATVDNWLEASLRSRLHEREKRIKYLTAMSKVYPEVLNDEVFLKPQRIEWEPLREIAAAVMTSDRYFDVVYLTIAEKFKQETDAAIYKSEAARNANPRDEPFVYLPTADFSTRLDLKIPEVVRLSAFLDFLESPLAEDSQIVHSTAKRIELDVLSLWRAYLPTTTIGAGETKFVYDPTTEQKFDIQFGKGPKRDGFRDRREERMHQYTNDEQQRFARIFRGEISELQKNIEMRSRFTRKQGNLDNTSFEILLMQSKRE